jgi:hypothetical protein
MSATNVDQTTPIRATTFDGSAINTSMIADTVMSSPNDLVMDGVCSGSGINTAGAEQTLRYLQNITNSIACGSFAGSSAPGASPWVATAWTSFSNDFWVFMGLSLRSVGSL